MKNKLPIKKSHKKNKDTQIIFRISRTKKRLVKKFLARSETTLSKALSNYVNLLISYDMVIGGKKTKFIIGKHPYSKK